MGGYYVANLTCLDVTTGNTKWSVATNDSQYTAPTIANGRVYAGNGDNISCYDAVSGVSYWNYTAPVVSPTTVAVAGGYVYFGSGNMIYCVDATNGAFQWGHSTGDTTTAVAVAGGRVYAGSLDHIVYCLDATNLGSQIWAFTTNAEVYSSPVIANGRVYVKNVGDYSKVYCLNAGTGTLNWSYECHTTGGYSMDASPSIANGYLYQSVNGYVYCLPMIFIQPSGTTGTDGVPGYPLWAVVAMGVLAVGVIARKRKIGK
jgi:outer membrane protein assembly factor BamB